MPARTIIIGSDHAGFALKEILKKHLAERKIEVVDMGPADALSVDYPDFAKKVCREVLDRKAQGVLVCGTGVGMSMAANRFCGIRAAVCANAFQCRMTRMHNDANVLCLGERVTGQGAALDMLDIFLDTDFEGGRHQGRIEKIEPAD